MELETFEQLWPRRDQVDSTTRAELERLAKSDAQCRAYIDNGEWVRDLMKDLDPILAPPDFAYRMRLYAANHPDAEKLRSSWMRWPVVTVGAVAGAAAVFLAFGPLSTVENLSPAGAMTSTESSQVEPAPVNFESVTADPLLAEASDSTIQSDSLKYVERDIPEWDLHTVSTGE